MYKREFKLPSQYINNFYDGSIYDLVFLDLEWCRDFQKEGLVQKIFGYTLTRILEDSNEQYIKIQFIESSTQEKKIIQDILNDLQILQGKYFIGYGLSTSDMFCLRKRIEALDFIPKIDSIRILDLQRTSQRNDLNQGLNNLFAYLGIPIYKRIKGYYIFRNGIKILRKDKGYETILNEIYEYCLEDAENYFHIISNWQTQFPLVDRNKHQTINLKIDARSEQRINSVRRAALQRPS
ncbi:ribonuclease H-like domain-containing protein [Pseudanabaena sp. FACHB-1998]|uniref:ribonuclease H-like domain-containing protein n=1 Tax=Pseudanabaena sp. FACHB-1998 TaxID=2692858 RepID=UPI0016809F8C|nr:ribonuclease H-like domain-containing protein [Pseudanabaena sp. FACHB-1998]MBD2175938.1 ribonuclease H-like domain-containing protein [Pseudanabaena sp. FACHB-1998]